MEKAAIFYGYIFCLKNEKRVCYITPNECSADKEGTNVIGWHQGTYDNGIIKSNESEKLAAEYHGIVMLGYFTDDLKRLEISLADFYKRVFGGRL